MKRILIIAITLLFSLSLVSCSMVVDSVNNIKSGTNVLIKQMTKKDKDESKKADKKETKETKKETGKIKKETEKTKKETEKSTKETDKKNHETKETEKATEETKKPETQKTETQAPETTKKTETTKTCTHQSSGAATCTKNETCKLCGTVLKKALGHSYSQNACIRCGKLDPDYSPPTHTTHNYQKYVSRDATCTKEGLITYTCPTCGDSYTETIPLVAHSWADRTCTAPKTCRVCGKTEGSASGHSYYGGSCSNCGASDPNYSTSNCWDCGRTIPESDWRCSSCSYNTSCYVCGRTLSTNELYVCWSCMS
ncbi:MAG: hypothetical protein IKU52_01155 [Clostridia bacterium]|nr:hypothetical protein [Clostridia bacterium]